MRTRPTRGLIGRLRFAGGLALLGGVTACGSALGAGAVCTAVGTPVGVGLDIAPSDAAQVESAAVEVCWDEVCTESEVSLRGTSDTVEETCDDEVCSMSASPDGGLRGMAFVDGLPTEPVDVSVRLADRSGDVVMEDQVTVVPEMIEANGPGCGEAGPQAQVEVESGALHER